MGDSKASTIPLGRYLFERIHQLGIRSIIGVPGDMNLELLDYIDEIDGMSWVGTGNELGAAYACDGYSRVKGAPGVLITTMGVGELSAINGVAGAYTEHVKLIHIVGTTATATQKRRLMIHHCLGPDPDHRVYEKISSHVRAAHCLLDDANTAASEIDRVIRECYTQSLPVYIFVPMDFVHKRVDANTLLQPMNLESESAADQEQRAIEDVCSVIQAAKIPTLLVDCLVSRFRATDMVRKIAAHLQFPTFSTSMGKSIIDEKDNPYFYGTYNGKICPTWIHEYIEDQADLVIEFGPLLSDSNTGGHSREIAVSKVVSISPTSVTCCGRTYENVYIRSFTSKLYKRLLQIQIPKTASLPSRTDMTISGGSHITQDYIWHRLAEFLQPDDILIAESGTAQFGFPDAILPPNTTYITQVYYGSIGYSVGACLGAAIAKREQSSSGRIVLVVGDGSLQLTVQEVGTMVRLGLEKIMIIVINNKGYTIERAIHGPEKAYNDIATYNHQLMLPFFNHPSGSEASHQAHTRDELENILHSSKFADPQNIQLLEIHMDIMDIPWRLRDQIELVKSRQLAAQKAQPHD